ncbi:MAG: VCBS repeat-containing protein [Bdellovibrionales bacterium]|nr:VCBS repeat-containing protein [Bdellovibrionales bacterium]
MSKVIKFFVSLAVLSLFSFYSYGFDSVYLKGEYTSNQMGAASYSVPLEIPKGAGGFQPSLVLSYSSQGINGLMGMGWSISGQSSISRCSATLAQDGFQAGITLSANDRFCLDGAKLLAISGTYGANGTEYRTENEDFSRIYSYGTSGTGPNYFVVYSKNGKKFTYGNTLDSKIKAQTNPNVVIWALDSATDINGNYYTIQYQNDPTNGQYYPLEISYTGNVNNAVSPSNSVKFFYESRPDLSPVYRGSINLSSLVRLKNIKTYANSVQVYNYQFGYQQSAQTGRSLLMSINVSSADGTKSLLPTSFNWNGPGATYSSTVTLPVQTMGSGASVPVNYIGGVGSGNSGSGIYNNSNSEWLSGDFNGDGISDFIQPTPNATSVPVCFSTFGGGAFNCTNYALSTALSTGDFITGDFDGDGKTDFAQVNSGVNTMTVCYSVGDGNFSCVQKTMPGLAPIASGLTIKWQGRGSPNVSYRFFSADFNGDGRADTFELATNGANPEVCLSNGRAVDNNCYSLSMPDFSPVNVIVGDFDGDGRTDIAYAIENPAWTGLPGNPNAPMLEGKIKVCYSDGGGAFTCETKDTLMGSHGKTCDFRNVCLGPYFAGDFNGDGISDIAEFGSDGTIAINFAAGRGLAFSSVQNPIANMSGWKSSPLLVSDLNGDGKNDIITKDGTATEICYSRGTGVFDCTNGPTISETNILFGNFTGDATTSILGGEITNSDAKVYVNPTTIPDLMTSISTGIGGNYNIIYQPLTNPAVHTRSATSVYPIQDVQFPFWVTSVEKEDDGNGGQREKSYQYFGAKTDLTGRGFLGFAEVDQNDLTANRYSKLKLTQLFPLTGQVFEFAKYAYNAALSKFVMASQTLSNYGAKKIDGTRYIPLLLTRQDLSYDINSEQLISNVGLYRKYDSYGNLVYEANVTNDGYITQKNFEISNFTGSPIASQANWYIGRVGKISQKNIMPDGSNTTRTKAYTYDSKHRLLQERLEPNNSTTYVATNYTYDVFGNMLTRSISGSNLPARTETFVFDSVGVYPIVKSNSYYHTRNFTYDSRFGLPNKIIDENNLSTFLVYDVLGRKIKETTPDGIQTNFGYEVCNTTVCSPNLSFFTTMSRRGSPSKYLYFDHLGRDAVTQTGGFNGQWIYSYKQYNQIGNLQSQSRNSNGQSNYKTEFLYDPLDRVVSETSPDGSQKRITYTGLTTVIKNNKGQLRTTIRNSVGQVISIKDDSNKITSYKYDPFGNLVKTIDPAGNQISTTYDVLGYKTSKTDTNSGTTNFVHNAIGELISITDARGGAISTTFDNLGRVKIRTTSEGTSTWVYDSSANGIGKIASVSRDNGYSKIYSYDSLGRPTSTQITMDTNYNFSVSYNADGKVGQVNYPTGFAVKYKYDVNGFMTEVDNAATNTLLWKVTEVNADNDPIKEVFGNNIQTEKSYYAETGLLKSVIATPSSGSEVQNLSLSYDKLGNLTSRAELYNQSTGATITENFDYDGLNRLVSVSGPNSKSFSYDDIGNIVSKSDVGTYTYGNGSAGHPINGVASVVGATSSSYTYDASGNMLTGNGRTISWSTFNKPLTISNASNTINFYYDTDLERFKEVASTCRDHNGTVSSTCIKYVINPGFGTGFQFEKEINGSITTYRNYLYAGQANNFGVYTTTSDGQTSTRYFHKDHLSSVTLVTNESGAVSERFSYDAFGKRRNLDGSDDPYNALRSLVTHQGFTLHEHLDDGGLGLVHMNGRVYDPQLGRFMSVDAVVSDLTNIQTANGFSYVSNNPLTLTDPSGYWSLGSIISDTVNGIGDFLSHNVGNIAAAIHDTIKWYSENAQTIIVTNIAIGAAILTFGYAAPYLAGSLGTIGAGVAAGAAAGAVAGAIYSTLTTGFSWAAVAKGALFGAAIGGSIGGWQAAGGFSGLMPGISSVGGSAAVEGTVTWLNGNRSWEAFTQGIEVYFRYPETALATYIGGMIAGPLTDAIDSKLGDIGFKLIDVQGLNSWIGGFMLAHTIDKKVSKHRASTDEKNFFGLFYFILPPVLGMPSE